MFKNVVLKTLIMIYEQLQFFDIMIYIIASLGHYDLYYWEFRTLCFIMPPGTIVPMGAYCFYCVLLYVCMYVRMSEFG